MDSSEHDPKYPPGPAGRRLASPRVLAGAALGLTVLVAGGYWLLWSFLARGVEEGIDAWAAARRAEGFQVSYSAVDVTGFPGWIRATVAAPEVARPGPGSWSWQAPGTVFQARPWRLRQFTLSASGRHRITRIHGGRPTEMTLDVGTLTVKARLRGVGLGRIRLKLRDVEAHDDLGTRLASVAAAEIALARPAAELASPGTDPALAPAGSFSLDVDADGLRLAREPGPGLGGETAGLTFGAVVRGPLPAKAGAEALTHWRDAGGIVELRLRRLRHGPLAATGEGTLALDDALQPIGAFTVRVRGFADALDRLRDASLIEPRPAGLVKALLSTMAKKGTDGDGAEVTLPLSVQDRRFYVGPIPLARLPRIRWP